MAAPENNVASLESTTVNAEPTINSSDVLDPDTLYKLQFPWSIWYKSPPDDPSKRQHSWVARHAKLVDFNTIQGFWRIFNNLIAPSTLKEGADIYLFRLNVEPKWEDHFNQAGGNFFFYLAPQGGYDQQLDADAIWLNLLLHIVGDHFDDADEICGLIVSKKSKGFRFNLWIKTANDMDARKRIAKQLKKIACFTKDRSVRFISHEDKMNSRQKPAKVY